MSGPNSKRTDVAGDYAPLPGDCKPSSGKPAEARNAPSAWDGGAALGSPQPERPNALGGAMVGEMGGVRISGS